MIKVDHESTIKINMLSIFKRFPPKIATWLLIIILCIFSLIRFFLTTILGSLTLSIVLYWIMWLMGESKPFTPAQLVIWIDELPFEAKSAIFTSLITVIGFMIAFHTATINWKSQEMVHLKISAANDIEQFFNEAARLTSAADIYIRSLIEAANFAKINGPTPDAIFKVRYSMEQAPDFLKTRNRLSAMSVEVHRITGRHFAVLSSVWMATKEITECADRFTDITSKMWVFVPHINKNETDFEMVSRFVFQLNIAECEEFVQCYQRNDSFISGISGGLRGSLLAPVVGFNFSALMAFIGKKSSFIKMLSEIKGTKQ